MPRAIAFLLLFCFPSISLLFACSCGPPAPACVYVHRAQVIFLGKVTFTDEDNSGTFLQKTLVRFQVEEAFKGLSPGANEVWIDPGSFTSCYAVYELGTRYLVFGYGGGIFPPDTAAITLGSAAEAKRKPLPPGIDPRNPPMVYSAPECSGTRLMTPETEKRYSSDLAYLRQFKEGRAIPYVSGLITEERYSGWADHHGLAGVQVTLAGRSGERKTKTDGEGQYSFERVQPGSYVVTPFLVAYESESERIEVPEDGCGYVEFDMIGTGSIEGQLLDWQGDPGRHVQLNLLRLGNDGKPISYGSKRTESDSRGRYRFESLPKGDFALGVALYDPPDLNTPYPPTKWSENGRDSIHLEAGEHKRVASFRLPAPLARRTVAVSVHWPDGRPAEGAYVFAEVNGTGSVSGRTNRHGVAHLDLLEGIAYSLNASLYPDTTGHQQPTGSKTRVAKSKGQPLPMGLAQIDLQIDFDEKAHP